MLFFVLALAANAAHGQDVLELTLGEAVGAALSRNLSVEEEAILRKSAEAAILEAKGEFDPTLGAEISATKTKEASVTSFVSSDQEMVNYGASLGGKLKTGTAYELAIEGAKVDRSANPFLLINPYYPSDIVITITQPLLKGLGVKVQESRIRAAEAESEAARLRAEHRAMGVVAETVSAYWELYFARANLDAAEISLRLAESTLEAVNARIEAGTLAPVEVFKAEAEAAIREEKFLGARKAVFDAEDALRAIMNTTDWYAEIVPVEVPPEPTPEAPVLEGLLTDAFENRRDLKQARSEQKSQEILRDYYKNQSLPELDIIGSAGTSGLGSSYGDALESAGEGDFYSWRVGLALEIPLGNRALKGRYLRAKHDVELASLRVKALRQEVTVEVREALRALLLAKESIRASGRTKVASEKRLEAEEERFRLGMATLNDVLRFQQEYADALSSEKRAITDYAGASVMLRRATGTLLPPGGH